MKIPEIPIGSEKTRLYRLFEMMPGFISWNVILAPIWVSLISPNVAASLIIAYVLVWFIKAMVMNLRVVQGYAMMRKHQKLDWQEMIRQLDNHTDVHEIHRKIPKWHYKNLIRVAERDFKYHSDDIIHAVFIAFYNESRDVLEPTIQSVLNSKYEAKKVVLILAFEERGGPEIEKLAKDLIKDYGDKFFYAAAVKHPDGLPNEVRGKGGNITYAARVLKEWLDTHKIDYGRVIVTTLDSDNRPDPQYLASLTYMYIACPDSLRASFQPLPMYTSNIWDVPAMMRVIATGNSYWNLVLSNRVHLLRNFSSHAQGMESLVHTDFWSTRTIVEDGHQFWRSYFAFEGRYIVYPIYLPIYQDAVLSNTYRKTLKAQFIQIRRWAYGASDIPYLVVNGFFRPNKISRNDLWVKTLRLVEGHISWATSAIIIGFASFAPININPHGKDNIVANQLPTITSWLATLALVGILLTMFLSFKTLPPRPKRYKAHRNILMVLQWVFLPVTPLLYNTSAAINSQTRLLFGRYLGNFDVTDKAVKKD